MLDVLAFSLKNDDYLNHKASDIIGSTNESLTLWCEESQKPLYFAMEQFINGVHHSLVQDAADASAPLKYLAQTDIVRYLIHHTDAFPSLEVLLMQPTEVVISCFLVSVQLSTPLTEAIPLLVEHGAVPVVNEAGECLHVHLLSACLLHVLYGSIYVQVLFCVTFYLLIS
jgi:hypothetical protein